MTATDTPAGVVTAGEPGTAGAASEPVPNGFEHHSEAWDDALLRLGGHFLQSWRWGEFKRRHGWHVERIRVAGSDGEAMAQVLYRTRGPVSVGYVPRGPAIGGKGPVVAPRLFRALDEDSRRQRALSVILEPDGRLPLTGSYKNAGFVRGPAHVQPGRTVKVPLLDDEALLNQMHQKTRYNVRLAQRRGVRVERPPVDDGSLGDFYGLLEDTSRRNEFGIHDRAYYDDFMQTFGADCVLLFARVDEKIAAGLIAARFGREAIYMYGASSTANRAHGAAFYLQFEAMRWARDNGCRTYDLWGIPAADPVSTEGEGHRVAGTRGDDWRGLYKFKTGFGGQVVTYPPTLERRYRPILGWFARRTSRMRG